MPSASYSIVLTPGPDLTLSHAADMSGLHPEMILEFVRAEVINVSSHDGSGVPLFRNHHITRLRKIQHLRFVERVKFRTIRYLMKLLDRLEAAEQELRTLREKRA